MPWYKSIYYIWRWSPIIQSLDLLLWLRHWSHRLRRGRQPRNRCRRCLDAHLRDRAYQQIWRSCWRLTQIILPPSRSVSGLIWLSQTSSAMLFWTRHGSLDPPPLPESDLEGCVEVLIRVKSDSLTQDIFELCYGRFALAEAIQRCRAHPQLQAARFWVPDTYLRQRDHQWFFRPSSTSRRSRYLDLKLLKTKIVYQLPPDWEISKNFYGCDRKRSSQRSRWCLPHHHSTSLTLSMPSL